MSIACRRFSTSVSLIALSARAAAGYVALVRKMSFGVVVQITFRHTSVLQPSVALFWNSIMSRNLRHQSFSYSTHGHTGSNMWQGSVAYAEQLHIIIYHNLNAQHPACHTWLRRLNSDGMRRAVGWKACLNPPPCRSQHFPSIFSYENFKGSFSCSATFTLRLLLQSFFLVFFFYFGLVTLQSIERVDCPCQLSPTKCRGWCNQMILNACKPFIFYLSDWISSFDFGI